MADVPPSHHRPRKAEVVLSALAMKQTEAFSLDQALTAERALAAIAANPEIGDPKPGRIWDYQDDGGARVLYTMTVMRTIVIVGYVEA
jgi:hypothetical protein